MYLALKPAKTRRNPPKPTKTDQKNALKRTETHRPDTEKVGKSRKNFCRRWAGPGPGPGPGLTSMSINAGAMSAGVYDW